ncbi:MAG: copper-binding protein [Balneolaceae bacterium]
MILFYRGFSILLLFIFLNACQSDSHDHQNASEQTHAEAEQAPVEIFEGTGTVISIPPSKRNFIVQHGDIPGFMNSMTMAFSVRDTAILQNVEPRDSIRFEIESQGSSAVVITLEVIEKNN